MLHLSSDLKVMNADPYLIAKIQNMLLIAEIISVSPDELTVRVHLRAQMEVSGLRRILDKLTELSDLNSTLQRMVADFVLYGKQDDADVAEKMKEDVRMNFTDPKGVYDAIVINTEGRALDFFTSAMKHLLLVPQEGDLRLRYFQLIDKLVSAVVTDRKGLDGDFTSLLGSSVTSIAARYGDQDRLRAALEEADDARLALVKSNRLREELEEELALKDEGLVGRLKADVEKLKLALISSRDASQAICGEFVAREREYQEKVVLLDSQIRDLSSVLLEQGGDAVGSGSEGVLRRQQLVDTYRTREMREKAEKRLEGAPTSLTTSGVNLTARQKRSGVSLHFPLFSHSGLATVIAILTGLPHSLDPLRGVYLDLILIVLLVDYLFPPLPLQPP
jgi:hypothetical protein